MDGRSSGSGTKERFTGQERDAESGLDYFGARYYMPALGRWMAVDPMGDLYAGVSPYVYVLNSPAGLTDPDGRCVGKLPCPTVGDVMAFVAGTAVAVTDNASWGAVNNRSAVGELYATNATAYNMGQNFGDLASFAAGGLEAIEGAIVGAGGTVLSGGALAVPSVAAGGAMMCMGRGMAVRAGQSLLSQEGRLNATGKRHFSKADRAAGLEKSRDASGTPRCEYCGTELDPKSGKPNSYEADHRRSYKNGGESTQENLAPSCMACNRSKGSKNADEWEPKNDTN